MCETSHFAEVKFKSLACQISPDSFELCRDKNSRVKGNGEKGNNFAEKRVVPWTLKHGARAKRRGANLRGTATARSFLRNCRIFPKHNNMNKEEGAVFLVQPSKGTFMLCSYTLLKQSISFMSFSKNSFLQVSKRQGEKWKGQSKTTMTSASVHHTVHLVTAVAAEMRTPGNCTCRG